MQNVYIGLDIPQDDDVSEIYMLASPFFFGVLSNGKSGKLAARNSVCGRRHNLVSWSHNEFCSYSDWGYILVFWSHT